MPIIEIAFLKKTVRWVVISGLFGLAVMVISTLQYNSSYDQYVLQKAELNSIKLESQRISEDLKILQFSLPRFNEMKKKRLIGEEDRLGWLEVLGETVKGLKAEKFEYRIDEQKLFDSPEFAVTGDYQVFTSQMHLSMSLLHEGDFFKIIEALKTEAKGLFHINECEFTRLQQELKTDVSSNLDAQCNLTWFTIRYNSMNNEVET